MGGGWGVEGGGGEVGGEGGEGRQLTLNHTHRVKLFKL